MPISQSILLIFAHPDDESFAAAGTALRYSEQGAHLVLVTATRGDKGKCGEPPVCTEEALPLVRERELRVAASVLGIADLHVLDYKDKELSGADRKKIREQLVGHIRHHRPQVIITFDPDGANEHPDHIAISRFASDAIAAAADPRWLPETGAAHQVARLLWTTPQLVWDVARSAHPEAEPGVDFLIDTKRWWQRKAEALRAHRSQNISINEAFLHQPDVERILSTEAFRQGWGPPLAERPADDLFDGLNSDTDSGD